MNRGEHPDDVIVEVAEFETDCCPCCQGDEWLRAIATYGYRAFYVIYCANCGKPIEERWTGMA